MPNAIDIVHYAVTQLAYPFWTLCAAAGVWHTIINFVEEMKK